MLQRGFEHERQGRSSSQVFHIPENLHTSCCPKHLIPQSPEVKPNDQNASVFLGLVKTINQPFAPPTPYSFGYAASEESPPWLPVFLLKLQAWAVRLSSQLLLPQHPLALRNHITPKLSCDGIRHTCPIHSPFPLLLCVL